MVSAVLPMADLTATATLILAGITLGLALAIVALVNAIRRGTAQARADAAAQLQVLQRQLHAGHRPLLVDVLRTAPVPDDTEAAHTTLPGIEPEHFDPRTVHVKLAASQVSISVPLRNVGRGLAVIDGLGVEITGPGLGEPEYRAVQRRHVPVDETTRIELVASHATDEPVTSGAVWTVRVPYTDFAGEQRSNARLEIVCRGEDAEGPWYVERVDQEADRDELMYVAEAPAPAAPARREPRREPVTDLWGNPKSKGKDR